MRYLVATGEPSSNGVKTEIVDLSDPTMSCLLEDIPYRAYSAGGLLGTTPVICGGRDGNWNYLNDCIFYGTSESISMNAKRWHASSVALTNNKLWIMGGYGGYGNGRLDSTEFITIDGTVNGPTLPEAVSSSCSVKFPDSGDVYLIGGYTSSGHTNKVWMANPSNEYATFNQGPSMMTARSVHGCSTMSIGTKSIIVTAGGFTCNFLKSVEILDPLSNQWVAGK